MYKKIVQGNRVRVFGGMGALQGIIFKNISCHKWTSQPKNHSWKVLTVKFHFQKLFIIHTHTHIHGLKIMGNEHLLKGDARIPTALQE